MSCLWDVVEERSASGSLRACLFERSEFAGPPLARVPQSRREATDVPKAEHLRPPLAREAVSLDAREKKNTSCEATSRQQRLAQMRRL